MIEANRASSSAKDVSMTTAVFGCFARISRVASMPLPSASRTSMTTTSGRVRSASSMASRTEPASAVTTMSSVACRSAFTPLRTTSWSSTSSTRRGGLATALHPTGDTVAGVSARNRSHLEGLADAVEEVLGRRLGHPVQEGAVERPSEQAHRRSVPGADRELGAVRAEGGDLQVGVEGGEQALGAGRLPRHRKERLPRDPVGLTEPDLDLLVEAMRVVDREADLGEQVLPPALGIARGPREPGLGLNEERRLQRLERDRQVEVIPDEHGPVRMGGLR